MHISRLACRGLVWVASVLAFVARAQATPGDCRAEELERVLRNPRASEVRQSLEECSRGDPREPNVMVVLGRGYLLEGDEQRAALWFERATALDPKCSECQLWLGRAYGAEAMQATLIHQTTLAKKVRKAFERAVELDANNLPARTALVEDYSREPGFLGGGREKALRA